MSTYSHKSGAQKRKTRKAKEEKQKKGQTTFESFNFLKRPRTDQSKIEISSSGSEPGNNFFQIPADSIGRMGYGF
jgi:hypothetical protein